MSWKYFILFVSIHGVRWCVSTLSFSYLFMEVLWWFCNPADSTYGAPDEVVFLSISQKIWCCFSKNIRPVPQVHLILPQIKYHNFFDFIYSSGPRNIGPRAPPGSLLSFEKRRHIHGPPALPERLWVGFASNYVNWDVGITDIYRYRKHWFTYRSPHYSMKSCSLWMFQTNSHLGFSDHIL